MSKDILEISESGVNVLKALYESSSVVRVYVDTIVNGHPIPYTILIRSDRYDDLEKFAKEMFELAFGCDAVNRGYSQEEVIARLNEFSNTALKQETNEDVIGGVKAKMKLQIGDQVELDGEFYKVVLDDNQVDLHLEFIEEE